MIGCTDSLSFLNYCPAPSIFLHPAVGSHDLCGRSAQGGGGFWGGILGFGGCPQEPPQKHSAHQDRAMPPFQGPSLRRHMERLPPGAWQQHRAALQCPALSCESLSFLWKEINISASFSALDPALDFCLASGEAGVFAKLLGCPTPYRGSDPSGVRRGSVWLCAAPHLLMGSLCPSVTPHPLCKAPVPLSRVHGRDGPVPCAVHKTQVPGVARRGASCVARRWGSNAHCPPRSLPI